MKAFLFSSLGFVWEQGGTDRATKCCQEGYLEDGQQHGAAVVLKEGRG